MDESKLCLARIKIQFPENKWISEIFKNYPDVELDISYFLPYDFEISIGTAKIEIRHFRIDQIANDIKKHPSVFEFSLLEKVKNRMIFIVKTRNPYILYCVIKCGVIIDFPVRIRENFAVWKLMSS